MCYLSLSQEVFFCLVLHPVNLIRLKGLKIRLYFNKEKKNGAVLCNNNKLLYNFYIMLLGATSCGYYRKKTDFLLPLS